MTTLWQTLMLAKRKVSRPCKSAGTQVDTHEDTQIQAQSTHGHPTSNWHRQVKITHCRIRICLSGNVV